MRLRTILINEPKSTLDALESCDIKTDEDLLLSSSSSLALFQRLPPGCIAFSDLERIRDQILKNTAVNGMSGLEILEELEPPNPSVDSTHKWTTGHSELDALLDAVNPGVIEVAGGKGSAKTTLALNVALSWLASAQDDIVHWIDTVGDFSAERASKILGASPWAQMPLGSSLNAYANSALERLHVSLAFTTEAAHDTLVAIRSMAASSADTRRILADSVRLIIIDSITPLFAPHLTTGSSEGQARMTAFMRDLQDLAIARGLIVLVTNNATAALPCNPASAFVSTRLKPALGLTLTFLTDTTLWLSRVRDVLNLDNSSKDAVEFAIDAPARNMDNLYVAEVLRSRSTVGHVWWPFSLNDGVLCELPALPA